MPGSVTVRGTLADGRRVERTFTEHAIVVAGRAEDCGITLPASDRSASRHHFLLEVNPPEVVLKDLGGAAGTQVDGVRYGGRSRRETEDGVKRGAVVVKLRDGTQVKAGDNSFIVSVTRPERCPSCGAEVAVAGLCSGCSDTVRPGGPVGEPRFSVRCNECGKESPSHAESHTGDWICTACRTMIGSDPLQLSAPREAPRVSTDDVRCQVPGFDVVSRLGEGGMGAVYLARRIHDGMWTALKVLLARVAVDEAARTRFERESRIVEQLDHPNIVQFFDRGSDGALFYLAMEFCGGGSVSDLMVRSNGKLPLHDAGPIALQLLSALEYAHQHEISVELGDGSRQRMRGLVHRDVKPANILLTGSDRRRVCKLSDFGLAKSFQAAGLSGCTVSGQMGGTMQYMPPEQVSGFRDVTPAADLWCTGASLYEMLTGCDPRDLDNSLNPFQVILDGRIKPIRDHEPSISEDLAGVIERALERSPEDRYPDAHSMRIALLQTLYGADPSWSSDQPGSTSGTLLVPASDELARTNLALFHIGVSSGAAERFMDRAALDRIAELHRAITAQRECKDVVFLKCTGSGFLGACKQVSEATGLVRHVLLQRDDPRFALRGATHYGSFERTPEGDVLGMEVEWLLSVQDVEERMRTDESDGVRLGAGGRSLITAAARSRLSELHARSIDAAGRFKLPRFGRNEALFADRL